MQLISNFYKKGTCADQSRPLPLSLNPYRDVYKVARSCRGYRSYFSGDLSKAVKRLPSPQIYHDENKTYVVHKSKTSQELQMLSRSISDCKSLTLNIMIQVCQ